MHGYASATRARGPPPAPRRPIGARGAIRSNPKHMLPQVGAGAVPGGASAGYSPLKVCVAVTGPPEYAASVSASGSRIAAAIRTVPRPVIVIGSDPATGRSSTYAEEDAGTTPSVEPSTTHGSLVRFTGPRSPSSAGSAAYCSSVSDTSDCGPDSSPPPSVSSRYGVPADCVAGSSSMPLTMTRPVVWKRPGVCPCPPALPPVCSGAPWYVHGASTAQTTRSPNRTTRSSADTPQFGGPGASDLP